MERKINLENIIALLSLPKVGRKTAHKLLNALNHKISDKNDLADFINEKKSTIKLPEYGEADYTLAYDKAKDVLEKSEKQGVKAVSYLDDQFPSQLKSIDDCPVILYYKGNINSLMDKVNVAVIGTREPSELGERIGQRLGEVFADYDFNVISGLAIGCDTAGHKGALKGGGTTTAVMAHGLDQVYPKENKELAQEILEKGGAIVSEYPVGQRPIGNFFVERDRIQAGLSESVFVVETDVKGGTMHTAKYCLDYNRKLICFNHPEPNRAHPKAQGNQKLIKEKKAIPVYSKDEIDTMILSMQWDYFDPAEKKQAFNSLINHIVPNAAVENASENVIVLTNEEHARYEHFKPIIATIGSRFKAEDGFYKKWAIFSEGKTEDSFFKRYMTDHYTVYSWLDDHLTEYAKEVPNKINLIPIENFIDAIIKNKDSKPNSQLDIWE